MADAKQFFRAWTVRHASDSAPAPSRWRFVGGCVVLLMLGMALVGWTDVLLSPRLGRPVARGVAGFIGGTMFLYASRLHADRGERVVAAVAGGLVVGLLSALGSVVGIL
ncbi:MAG: hypothetical protein NVS1B4_24780 [Gemmatimonadaceae bacterium]